MSKFSNIRQVDPMNFTDFKKIMKFIPANDPLQRTLRADQLIVSYDRRKEKAVYYKAGTTFMSLLRRNEQEELYFLDSYEKITAIQYCRFSSTHFKPIELQLTYGITLVKGSELLLVEALAKRDMPDKQLNDHFAKWVNEELTNSHNLVYDNFQEFTNKITDKVINEGTRIGLQLSVNVTYTIPDLPSHQVEHSISFIEETISIQPAQFNDFLSLGFEVVLIPVTPTVINISTQLALTDTADLKAMLIRWLQNFVREELTYNDLANSLQDKVRGDLIIYWNNQLRQSKQGWKVGDLKLSSLQDLPKEFKRESLEVNIILKNAEVQLKYTIVLYLANAALFMNGRVSNLELWVKEQLHKAAQHNLAGVLYAEFLSRFDEYTRRIKEQLNEETQRVGYQVDILLTSEVIDGSVLQIDFDFTAEEQTFETILNDKIQLRAIVSGSIANLDHETWKRFLTPSTLNIISREIKTNVHREIRNKILGVTPDNFYTKFNKEVPEEIKERVKSLLIQKYNLREDVDIHLIIEHSVLKERLDQLKQDSLYANISLFNGNIEFAIKFCVNSIDPKNWGGFAFKKYKDIESERTSLIEDVKTFFQEKLNSISPQQTLIGMVELCRVHYQDCIENVMTKRYVTIFIEDTITIKNALKEDINSALMASLRTRTGSLIAAIAERRVDLEKALLAGSMRLAKELQEEIDIFEIELNTIVSKATAMPALTAAPVRTNNEDIHPTP